MSILKNGTYALLCFAALLITPAGFGPGSRLGMAGAARAAVMAKAIVQPHRAAAPAASVAVTPDALRSAVLIALPAGALLGLGGYLLVFARAGGRWAGTALLTAGSGLWLGNALGLLLALFPAS